MYIIVLEAIITVRATIAKKFEAISHQFLHLQKMLLFPQFLLSNRCCFITDECSLNTSPSLDTSSDLFSSSVQDTSNSFLSSCSIPDTSDTSFNRSIPDISSSSLNSSISDAGVFMSSMPLTPTVATTDEIDEVINTVLQEQQKSREDATADTESHLADDTLEPPAPLDNQMICDIQKIASRLAAKSRQLLGMLNHGLVCENN